MKKEVRLNMSHVDDGTLHTYLDGELSPVEVERLEAHLTGCSTCRARLDEERALIERASKLLGIAVPPGPERTAPPLHQLKQPRVVGRRLVIPLAWAATIVIALGLGYYAAGRGSKMEGAEPVAASSQVAVSPLPSTPAPAEQRDQATATSNSGPARQESRQRAPAPVVDGQLADRSAREGSDEVVQQSSGAAAPLSAPRADIQVRGAEAPAAAAGNVVVLDTGGRFLSTRKAVARLSTTWPIIQPQPARDLLGTAPAVIPGYEVRALRRNPVAARQIVVEQEIGPGVVVSLFEQPVEQEM